MHTGNRNMKRDRCLERAFVQHMQCWAPDGSCLPALLPKRHATERHEVREKLSNVMLPMRVRPETHHSLNSGEIAQRNRASGV